MSNDSVTLPGNDRAVATDLIGAIHHQLIKLEFGDADSATQVSALNPLPVTMAGVPLPSGAATETTLASVLAKIIAAPATEATLASVLAKIIAAPSTEAKQDTLIAKDFATQTTLAAVLAKLIAAPATEAKQDTLIAKDFATQTTLAAVAASLAGTLTVAAHAVTNAGTFAVQASGATSAASGGIVSTSRLVTSPASTCALVVKSSPGRIYSIQCYNAATTVRYLKLYNKTTTPNVGTDTPVKTIPLPPTTGMILDWGNIGYYFSTGIGLGMTTGSADADTGALTADDVVGLGVDYV